MALTPEQIQVINKFKKEYFDRIFTGDTSRISIAEFMDKSKAEQVDFIKTWTVDEHTRLVTLEGNLTAQQGRVANLKEIARKALEDWGDNSMSDNNDEEKDKLEAIDRILPLDSKPLIVGKRIKELEVEVNQHKNQIREAGEQIKLLQNHINSEATKMVSKKGAIIELRKLIEATII